MPEVFRVFEHCHNPGRAAAQDHELARADYESVCETLDCTQPGDVERYKAVSDRLRKARDRLLEVMRA